MANNNPPSVDVFDPLSLPLGYMRQPDTPPLVPYKQHCKPGKTRQAQSWCNRSGSWLSKCHVSLKAHDSSMTPQQCQSIQELLKCLIFNKQLTDAQYWEAVALYQLLRGKRMRTALPDNVRANLRANGMPLALRLSEGLGAWQPIETAPKDGTELLGWRWDAGCMLISWTAPCNFMTTDELESTANGDSAWQEQEDWFYADFLHGGRLEGSETPTHWTPMPAQPQVASDAPMTVAPEVGERYWMVQVGRIENCHWLNNYYDGAALAQGRVFATEADAQACWDAYFGAPK